MKWDTLKGQDSVHLQLEIKQLKQVGKDTKPKDRPEKMESPHPKEIQDTLVELCSKILQCSEEDIRDDTNQYAVFNRDCFLEAIDFEKVEFLDKTEMQSLFDDDGPRLACGRNDLDLPRSLVTDKCLDEIMERDLISFAKQQNFTLKMYGELLSQGRIKRHNPRIYGRVESGSSLVECVVAAFGLHEDLHRIDTRDYIVIHDDWKDFVASISNPILADHIGIFFQNSASFLGGSFQAKELEAGKTFDFEFHGFQVIGTWKIGDQEGNNRLYIVKITSFDVPPLDNNNFLTIPISLCRLPTLKILRLSSNQIEIFPDDIRYLQSLAHLHIADNNLTRFPSSLLKLSDLSVLNLSGNQLKTLPDNMVGMESLDTLWLTDNPLMHIGGLWKIKSLKFLHLGNIPWERVDPRVWEMLSLEHLWIASKSLNHLPEEVGQLKNLKGLKVWYSNLSTLPEAPFIMTHLEELRITNNPLPDGELGRLKLALPDCTIY